MAPGMRRSHELALVGDGNHAWSSLCRRGSTAKLLLSRSCWAELRAGFSCSQLPGRIRSFLPPVVLPNPHCRGEDEKTPKNKAGSSSRVGISAKHPCLHALGYSCNSLRCATTAGSVPREKQRPGMPSVTEHPANPSCFPRGG